MKGWAITIVSAFVAAYVATITDTNPGNKLFIIVAIIPTIIFWFLDSFYLSKENKFIGMYNDVAGITEDKKHIALKEYEMPMKKYRGWKYSIFKAMLSPSEIILYGLIVISLFAFYKFV